MQNLQKVDRQVLPDRLEEYLAVIERNQRQILKLLLGKTSKPIPSTMTMKEAADYARYSMEHFRRLAVERRLIPFIRPTKCQKGKILFRKEDIDIFLNQGKTAKLVPKPGPGRPRRQKNDWRW